jgi:hypothetical protein
MRHRRYKYYLSPSLSSSLLHPTTIPHYNPNPSRLPPQTANIPCKVPPLCPMTPSSTIRSTSSCSRPCSPSSRSATSQTKCGPFSPKEWAERKLASPLTRFSPSSLSACPPETFTKLTAFSQHFNKFIKNGELIDGEDGAKVFLGGEALIQHKYDLGEIDAGERDDLINRIDENWVGCEIRKAYFFGDESLQGVSEVKNGVAEEAEDSDE